MTERPGHFPALNGLRCVCCVFVVAGHAFVGHRWGQEMGRLAQMGVHVFFVLSGFLITYLLLDERRRRGEFGLKNFYARRFLRIFPVYYFALAAALGLSLLLKEKFTVPFGCSYQQLDLARVATVYGLFCANWSGIKVPTCLDVLWSISVEEQFYLLFPPMLGLTRNPRQVGVLLGVGLAVSLLCKGFLAFNSPALLARNTLAVGDHLILGAFLALRFTISGSATVPPWAEVILLCAFGVFVVVVPEPYWLVVSSFFSSWLCLLIVAAAAFGRGPLSRMLRWSWSGRLGHLTYAGYVFHMYAVAVAWHLCARFASGQAWEVPMRFLLAVFLTFVVAYLVRQAFEGRILRWKDKFSS